MAGFFCFGAESTMGKRKAKQSKIQAEDVGKCDEKAVSPFEKFRGIGTPDIGRGRKAALRWCREMRGW
jgi:hypothetical protein